MSDNPFERWDLDPLAGPQAITEALRERVEDATDEHERAAIREDWEALTLHPRRRVELALLAHPETRPPVGRPSRPPRRRRAHPPLALADLAALPSIGAALHAEGPLLPDVPLEDDPLLQD